MCIPDATLQLQALKMVSLHLKSKGYLLLDLVNPFLVNLNGDPNPKPFFTRLNVHTGHRYTRFAATGKAGVDQVQELYGWYDEILENSLVKRQNYSMHWRILFPNEVQLMLTTAGFSIVRFEGDHLKGDFTMTSPKMNIIAQRVE